MEDSIIALNSSHKYEEKVQLITLNINAALQQHQEIERLVQLDFRTYRRGTSRKPARQEVFQKTSSSENNGSCA